MQIKRRCTSQLCDQVPGKESSDRAGEPLACIPFFAVVFKHDEAAQTRSRLAEPRRTGQGQPLTTAPCAWPVLVAEPSLARGCPQRPAWPGAVHNAQPGPGPSTAHSSAPAPARPLLFPLGPPHRQLTCRHKESGEKMRD